MDLDQLNEIYKDKIKITEKSLEFLDENSSSQETCSALNSDLVKITKLKSDMKDLKLKLSEWEDKLKIAGAINEKAVEFRQMFTSLMGNLDSVNFPAPKAPAQVPKKCAPQPLNERSLNTQPEKAARQVPRGNPNQQNVHFVPILTMEEFNSIPAYMRGRKFTYDCINQIIGEFNEAVASKYEFLNKGFQAMASMANKKKYKELRSQENKETKSKCFLVADDLRATPSLKAEATRKQFFTILRHLNRIQEIRGPGTFIRFCVKNN